MPRTPARRGARRDRAHGAEAGIRVANVFHAGDGNLHPLILFDGARARRARAGRGAAPATSCACASTLGGSITGEHGVGVEKRDYLPLMFSDGRHGAACGACATRSTRRRSPTAARCSRPRRDAVPRDASPSTSVEAVQEAVRAGPRVLPGRRRHEAGAVDPARRRRRRPRRLAACAASSSTTRPSCTLTALRRHAGRRGRRRAGRARPAPAVRPAAARGRARRSAAWSPPGRRARARFRHGGVRDFVIGVRFVDGTGRLVAGGGKVVKNAAGFDLPKLMVGSIGRLGVIVQLSLKVFPRPRAHRDARLRARRHRGRAATRWPRSARGPLDARRARPRAARRAVLVRLGGDAERARRARRPPRRGRARRAAERLGADDDAALWRDAAELRVDAAGRRVVRVALTRAAVAALAGGARAPPARARATASAPNVAWIAWPEERPLARARRGAARARPGRAWC